MGYTDVLKNCIKIAEERQSQYGEAGKSLEKCSLILKESFNLDLTVPEICHVLVALKLSRQSNSHKDDNFHDIINYLAISLFYNKDKNDKR